jgi:prolyl-tRNA editing enzyme YbaK/EbsC (Cys-tRNA(Pro) deacylase)
VSDLRLEFLPVEDHLELLAPPVADALEGWSGLSEVEVAEIDPGISDTAALVAASDVELADCANCVVVGGKRAGEERVAACLVLGTARADVNKVVRKRLDVRRASFLPMDEAVERTGMEYGGITPVGLPAGWSIWVDPSVLERDRVVIGAGRRAAKIRLPGRLVADLPGAEVVEGLALP